MFYADTCYNYNESQLLIQCACEIFEYLGNSTQEHVWVVMKIVRFQTEIVTLNPI
jgi:hypothetical protein